MFRRSGKGIVLLASLLCLAACQQKDPDLTKPTTEQTSSQEAIPVFKAVASHLVSQADQEELVKRLAAAGISQARQDSLIQGIQQFNQAVSTDKLLTAFQETNLLSPTYDPYQIQEDWQKNEPDFLGYNCRITTLSLLGDQIAAKADGSVDYDQTLAFDRSALDQDSSGLQDKDKAIFAQVFNPVLTQTATDSASYVKAIQTEWQQRGISFTAGKASMVSVFIQDQVEEGQEQFFIGHVGVLLEGEEGYTFVEKIAFQEPYQAVKFAKKADLETYLRTKYQSYLLPGQEDLIIFENDQEFKA